MVHNFRRSFKLYQTSHNSYITNNRFNLRSLLLGTDIDDNESKVSSDNISISSSSDPEENANVLFTLTMRKAELDELIIETIRKYKTIRGKSGIRVVNILHPQKWTSRNGRKLYSFNRYKLFEKIRHINLLFIYFIFFISRKYYYYRHWYR